MADLKNVAALSSLALPRCIECHSESHSEATYIRFRNELCSDKTGLQSSLTGI